MTMKDLLKGRFKFSSENIIAVLMFAFVMIFPAFVSAYKLQVYTNFFNSILLCMSIVLIWGYCGTFSFGQAAFYGLGAYIYGMISGNVENHALTPLILLVSVAAVGLIALILGYFMFYGGVNDVFVGILTQCVTLALSTFFGQTAGSEWHVGKVFLGGYNGMKGISPLYIGSYKISGFSGYYLSAIILFACLLIFKTVERSKAGYTLFAVRENRERSSLFGYDVPKIQMIVFAIGGAIAALAGVLYAAWGGYVAPNSMSVTQATIPVIIVASGGRKSPTAAMLFGFLYYFANNKLTGSGSEYSLLILGIALVLVLLFIPQGLFKALFGFIDDRIAKLFAPKNNVPETVE